MPLSGGHAPRASGESQTRPLRRRCRRSRSVRPPTSGPPRLPNAARAPRRIPTATGSTRWRPRLGELRLHECDVARMAAFFGQRARADRGRTSRRPPPAPAGQSARSSPASHSRRSFTAWPPESRSGSWSGSGFPKGPVEGATAASSSSSISSISSSTSSRPRLMTSSTNASDDAFVRFAHRAPSCRSRRVPLRGRRLSRPAEPKTWFARRPVRGGRNDSDTVELTVSRNHSDPSRRKARRFCLARLLLIFGLLVVHLGPCQYQ